MDYHCWGWHQPPFVCQGVGNFVLFLLRFQLNWCEYDYKIFSPSQNDSFTSLTRSYRTVTRTLIYVQVSIFHAHFIWIIPALIQNRNIHQFIWGNIVIFDCFLISCILGIKKIIKIYLFKKSWNIFAGNLKKKCLKLGRVVTFRS